MNDTPHYKVLLEKERDHLETQLDRLGKRDASQPNNWDVARSDIDVLQADENELADKNEELHVNSIVLDELETRYRLVVRALEKIEQGTYGVCEVSGAPIEPERLAANPAARTCKAEMGKEDKIAQ